MSSHGQKAALGRRSPYATKARHVAHKGLVVLGKRPNVRGFPDFFEFTPEVQTAEEYADLATRVATYFGDVDVPLVLNGPRFDLDPTLVPWFDPELVREPNWVTERPSGTGHLFVHRLTPSTLRQYLTHRGTGSIVDVRIHAYTEMQYFYARNQNTWPTYMPVEVALEKLRAIAPGATDAFILATGPSALEVDLENVTADVRITCNSAVRDLDRIRAYKPQIIACTDPVFHFGPSRYASAFRKDLVRAVEEVDAYVLACDDFVAPLLGLEPSLAERLIVIPSQLTGPWRWPTDRNPTVRLGTSVLTNLMLPIAMMLADRVSIAGADGRQPTEKYFWSHNPQLQYSDEMMQTVFDSHPAFFRDRDYADYYELHCAQIEEIMQVGEAAGKTFQGAAPSWIPAMRKRGAPEPVASGK